MPSRVFQGWVPMKEGGRGSRSTHDKTAQAGGEAAHIKTRVLEAGTPVEKGMTQGHA